MPPDLGRHLQRIEEETVCSETTREGQQTYSHFAYCTMLSRHPQSQVVHTYHKTARLACAKAIATFWAVGWRP